MSSLSVIVQITDEKLREKLREFSANDIAILLANLKNSIYTSIDRLPEIRIQSAPHEGK